MSLIKTSLLFFVLLLFACNKEESSTLTGTSTLTGKWKLIKYHNLKAGSSESEPSNIWNSIVIDFADNDSIGKMSGHTVTNTVLGDYELLKNNKMRTIRFGGTKAGEPPWGGKFWDAIHLAGSYKRYYDKMYIYFNSGTEKIEFEKQ
jgi:hypothetical protein